MALSAAEKQRRYRARRDADPEKRQAYVKSQKERYQKQLATGKRKLANDMTSRELRMQRKKWRTYKQDARKLKKAAEVLLTPPLSPATPGPAVPPVPQPDSRQKKQARRLKRRENSRLYRKLNLLEKHVAVERRRADMLRKRLERATPSNKDTPRSKTKKLLGRWNKNSKKTVRKTLAFHYTLMNELKSNYASKRNKKTIAEIVRGDILRKYRFRHHAEKEIGCRIRNTRKSKATSLSRRLSKDVREFFVRDDVSRMSTGMKNTITRSKVKRQKRLLNDTLSNLYLKYKSEKNVRISYTTFTRLRPFWVVQPNEIDRNTCLCKQCENVRYVAVRLQDLGLVSKCGLQEIVKCVACDIHNQKCMYGACSVCRENKIIENVKHVNDTVSWVQWKNVKETRVIRGSPKEIALTTKSTESGTIGDLVDSFHEQIWRYRKHHFNINNQHTHYRNLREKLTEKECLVHIDFSENYEGKLASEIQSMHFGASKNQVSLHTGVYYVRNKNEIKCVPFATASDSMQHGPAAIWQHLKPILSEISKTYPSVDCVHFFSDGPCSQYRQKGNFYLLSENIFSMGFTKSTWNFHEAGHGKGIPDGIGGTLKRMADRRVRYGTDIMTANQFVDTLRQETKIKLFVVEISEGQSEKLKKKSLKAVPGTMALHQIVITEPGHLLYRDVSCTCTEKNTCKDHAFKEFSFENKDTMQPKLRKEDAVKLEQPVDSSENFDSLIDRLQTCKNFSELKELCQNLNLESITGRQRSILGEKLDVYHQALDVYPGDVPGSEILFPVCVMADGNCLPSTGSIFACGDQERTHEMRARIVVELVKHQDMYLNHEYLGRGLQEPAKYNLPKTFAMYSDKYVPGIALTADTVKEVFEQEVLQIRKPKTFMGIWQIFGLSSVLQMTICSIYPKRGNPNVRTHLNRLITPRVHDSADIAHIMWCSTRRDMRATHWIPNHFVCVLPIELKRGDAVKAASELNDVSEMEVDESEVKADVSEREADVTEMEADANEVKAEVSEVKADKTEVKVDVSEVKADVTELKADVTELKADKTVVKVDVSEVKADANEMKADVTELKADVTEVKTDVSEREADVTEMEADANEVKAEVTELKADVSEVKADKTEVKVDESEMEVDANEMKADVTEVKTDVSETEADVTEMEADANEVKAEVTELKADVSEVKADKTEVKVDESEMEVDVNEMKADVTELKADVTEVKTDVSEREADVSEMEADENEVKAEVTELKADVSEVKADKTEVKADETEVKADVAVERISCETGLVRNMNIDLNQENLLGKYVVVIYDNLPYPGIVIDTEINDVQVECMHKVPGPLENCFFWPRKLKDRCWYVFDSIIAVIPPPQLIEGKSSHFAVKSPLWEQILAAL